MKKIEHVWQKRANKIGHENDVEIVERYLFYLQNSFSKKIWDSNSSQNEELYAWNFSKCSESRLPRSWGEEPLSNFKWGWTLALINVNVGF